MTPSQPPTHGATRTTTSRRQFLKWSSIAGLAVAAGPALAACAADSSDASQGGKVKLIHASQDPLVLWAVTYLAEDDGYYKDEGLEVERVLLAGGPPALTALLGRNGDANLSAPGELLAAVDKGQDLKVLMAHTNTFPGMIVVSKKFAKRVGVTETSPLAERQAALGQVSMPRMGITAPGSITDGVGRLALRQAGVDPGAKARIVPLGTASNAIAAMANNQIDAFFGAPPAAEIAMQQVGAIPLLVNQAGEIEGGDRFQGMTLQTRAAETKSSAQALQAVVNADVKALKALLDDPVGVGQLLRKTRFSALEQPVWDSTWKRIQQCWKSPYVQQDSLAAWFDAGLVDSGKVDGANFPYDKVLDMTFVDKAVKHLGWSQVSQ